MKVVAQLVFGPAGPPQQKSRVFAGLCLVNAVMAVADLLSWVFPLPLTPGCSAVVLGANFVFNILAVVLLVLFGRYLQLMLFARAASECDGTQGSGGVAVRMPAKRAAFIVAALYITGCVASLGNHTFFGVASDTRYYRGGLYAVS